MGGPRQKGVVPISMLKRLALVLSLTTTLMTGTAQPSDGLEIYEPDSAYATAPNVLLSTLPPGAEVRAKIDPAGAELVSANPQFANAVVTLDRDGLVRADVYVRIQRVLSLAGDDGSRANTIAQALNRAYARGDMRADRLLPGRRNNNYVIMAGREALITIDDKLATTQGAKPPTLVLRWLDNLRLAMGGVPFATAANRGGLFFSGSVTGHASWYGPGFNGRRAASGERFDQNSMTAAHKTLPFGTVLLVTNTNNSRSILVRINDRGPYVAGRMLDLSAAAARAIGMSGVATVRIDVLRH